MTPEFTEKKVLPPDDWPTLSEILDMNLTSPPKSLWTLTDSRLTAAWDPAKPGAEFTVLTECQFWTPFFLMSGVGMVYKQELVIRTATVTLKVPGELIEGERPTALLTITPEEDY